MMQIVIDISEELYKASQMFDARYEYTAQIPFTVIKNGIPLPKGHGDLIDRSDLIPDSDYEDGDFYAVSIGAIHGAPTIVEADNTKGEE